MSEKRFDFVEEVIRKKPRTSIVILQKLKPVLEVTLVITVGIFIFMFFMQDNIKQLLIEKQEEKQTDDMKIELNYTANDNKEFAQIEEGIEKSIVSVYCGVQDKSEQLLATGAIINYQSRLYILVSDTRLKNYKQLFVKFADGNKVEAEIFAKDEKLGFAVLIVDAQQIPKDTQEILTCAVIRATDNLKQNMDIIYQGNPYGERTFVFNGKVSAIREQTQIYDVYLRNIDTNISIGGVDEGFLFDYSGNLIGMVLKQFLDADVPTVSVASLSDMSRILEKMLNKESIAYFGISGTFVDELIQQYIEDDIFDAIYVLDVDKKSIAHKAGIMEGDIIFKADGKPMNGMQDLEKCIVAKKAGDSMTVMLRRKIGGKYKDVSITIRLESR